MGRFLGRLSAYLGPWDARTIGLRSLHVLNWACVLHLISGNVGTPAFMAGPSMLPTLANEGEMIFENIIGYRLRPDTLARGDVITVISPVSPSRVICKRVLGLPGDVICVDPTGEKAPSTEHVVVPKGHVWIIGDNAGSSRDSRDYGPVSKALIRGRVAARIWPPSRFTIFRNSTTYID